jgi:hypothetical protein
MHAGGRWKWKGGLGSEASSGLKNKLKQKGLGCGSSVKVLASKCGTLGSNPRTVKKLLGSENIFGYVVEYVPF